MPLYFPLNSLHIYAAAFCRNQTLHIKACAPFKGEAESPFSLRGVSHVNRPCRLKAEDYSWHFPHKPSITYTQ